MKVFVEVAECRSFVAASRRLDLSAPAVTRSIAKLENALGVRLFNRTTRHVRLTETGARFLADTRCILEDVEQAVARAGGSYAEPKGVLSVTAPVLFGQKHVLPVIAEYMKQYPLVKVRALFYDRVSNILEEGLDVAIRIGHLKDSSVYATRVGSVQKVVCASPAYLKEHGVPGHPSELADHAIIHASTVEPSTTWRFESKAGNKAVKVSPSLYCCQNGTAISAARQGLGITRLMSYQVGEDFDNGSLERILPGHESKPLPVSIVHLEGRQANTKIRSFIDLAVARLRANPYILH
ncbi:MAG: LysR family transcriptional regulator [Xanthomonadales bacterium]|nr:LysR family transcriptional regulator [Xanthomonadales bacterium]